jgi:transposase
METERIALSQRERDRLRVLHEVQQKQMTQIAAAKRLKISDRHIRRLLFRLREHGDRAVMHGLCGRRSNRRLTARLEQKIEWIAARSPQAKDGSNDCSKHCRTAW